MKLYEEYLQEIDRIPTSPIKFIVRLIKFFWSKTSLSVKITVGIIVSLSLTAFLYSVYRNIEEYDACEDMQDSEHKTICKQSSELKAISKMIIAIRTAKSKLDPNKKEDKSKIKHLDKQLDSLEEVRAKKELVFNRKLATLNKKVLTK